MIVGLPLDSRHNTNNTAWTENYGGNDCAAPDMKPACRRVCKPIDNMQATNIQVGKQANMQTDMQADNDKNS